MNPSFVESQKTRGRKAFSQTTIPDSQDFSTDLSQDSTGFGFTSRGRSFSLVGQETRTIAGASTRADTHHLSFESSIPSRQPGTVLGSFGTNSIPRWEEGDCLEDGQQGARAERSQAEGQVSGRPASSFEGYFTQVEVASGNPDLLGGSASRHTSNTAASQNEQPSNTLAEVTPTDDSQQAAQIISPLAAEAPLFYTQNEEDFFTASEDYEIVPDTLKKNTGRNHG